MEKGDEEYCCKNAIHSKNNEEPIICKITNKRCVCNKGYMSTSNIEYKYRLSRSVEFCPSYSK